jgi:DNA-binding HxlR family transcriptional regulator
MKLAMEVVGDRWSLLIVNEALAGTVRFNQLRQRLGISTNILSSRLNRLEALGILTSVAVKRDSSIRTYQLTEKGRGLQMVIVAMGRWESQFGSA